MTLARIADRLDRPGLLLFLPAAMLLALMLGGEVAIIPLSLGTLAAVAAMRRGRGTAVPVSDQVARTLDLTDLTLLDVPDGGLADLDPAGLEAAVDAKTVPNRSGRGVAVRSASRTTR